MKIIVSSQNHERVLCPVCFEVEAAALPSENICLCAGNVYLPAACEMQGDKAIVRFVLPYLPADEEVAFEVKEAQKAPAAMTACQGEKSVDFAQDGKHITTYYYGTDLAKPYMGPFFEPYGGQITRLDMTVKEHPHHRSLWISHGSVNGVDNWNENPEHGYIRAQKVTVEAENSVYARLTANNLWTDHYGKNLCDENTTYTLWATGDALRVIDVHIELCASYGDFTLGKTKEAGPIAVRMADGLVVGKTGRFETPTGVNEAEIWMKHAPWCDYCGKADGHSCGVVIMDNPQNFGYPTYWHARNYGLMAPNNSFLLPERVVKEGEKAVWDFRVIFHAGDTQAARIGARYMDYIAPPTVKTE